MIGAHTARAYLVNGVDDPVDAGVTADGLVLGVDKDNLVVLVGGVLVDPVGVEDTQVGAAAANALLGGGTERALVLQVVHTLVGRLAVRSALGSKLLAASPADANAVDDVALLGLVSETAGLVGTRRTRCAVDDIELSVLYSRTLSKTSTGYENVERRTSQQRTRRRKRRMSDCFFF